MKENSIDMDTFLPKVITFIIYISIIGIAVLCTSIAEKNLLKENKIKFIIASLFAILIPSVFAGLRGISVGIDVQVYSLKLYNNALNCSNLTSFLVSADTELGYGLLVYFATKIFRSIVGVHFSIAVLQILPVYLYAYYNRKSFSMRRQMLVYFSLFYLVGFNIMRQSIAAGLILLVYEFFREKKLFKATITGIISITFHTTAVLGIAYCIVAYFISTKKKKTTQAMYIVLLISVVLIGMNYWRDLMSIVINFSFVPDKYKLYMNSFLAGSDRFAYMFGVHWAGRFELLYKILCFGTPLLYYYRLKRRAYNDPYIRGTYYISLIGFLLYTTFFIVFKSAYGYRISLYGEYFFIPYIASVYNERISVRKLTMPISHLVMNIILISHVLIVFSILGAHGVSPFTFYS